MTFDEWWEIYNSELSEKGRHDEYKEMFRIVWKHALKYGNSESKQ